MKVLVDAVYINNSGGLVLLRYLIDEITKREMDIHFLLDERVRKYNLLPDSKATYMVGSEKNRNNFYKLYGSDFDSVLCFGNIPPTIRLKADVSTLFQNVILAKLPAQVPLLRRPKWLLKRYYIKRIKMNTDRWIVQTSNTKGLIASSFDVDPESIIICPFFDESKFPPIDGATKECYDYSYVAKCIPEKNHKLLLLAWIELAKMGLYPKLHITISNYPRDIQSLLDLALSLGCNIVNHGFCDLEQVKEIYKMSKAVVYTSMNESFGLGMIEAMNMGCDVIGPNLPYVTSICNPSERFDYDAHSLAEAIVKYEKGGSPKTENFVKNEIDRFLAIINDKHDL